MITLILAVSILASAVEYNFSEEDKARAVAAVHDVGFEEFGWDDV